MRRWPGRGSRVAATHGRRAGGCARAPGTVWRWLRRLSLAGALACAAAAVVAGATAGQGGSTAPGATAATAAQVARGRLLFVQGCSNCHGTDARGIRDQGPSLRGAGMAAADFYLSTGRMPLDNPTDEPLRAEPAYPASDIAALVAYIGTFGGDPIPQVHPERGSLSRGMQSFTDRCAGCHTVAGRGGVVTGAAVPALTQSTPRQVAEAIRVGPYLMPEWTASEIDQRTLDDIARYVQRIQHPDNLGGWGLGNVGPIPEGMVAWLLAGALLVGVARLIGERAP
jgi:ubiquinol-cytochrome c reductase cytochrome c subunit